MRFRLLPVFLILFLSAWRPARAQEIRAFWADGFSEGFKSPEQVDTLLRRLQTAHCNAIFAQMRKSGDAYYLSRYDPWANDNQQHFDALAYLIERAHTCKPRIQVHAWLNTCAVGKTYGNPHHIVNAHPDWKSLSDTGEDYDGEATKIDPGHPDAADWTFRVYLDVARHYDVDGIHFDFVRYGSTDGKGRFGYNPVSVARFNARYGRTGQPEWTDPLWKQWRRDQVTALVRKVYAMTQGVKPNVAVSAATITWMDGPHDAKGMSARKFWNEKSPGMNRVFQDWRSWMEEGILDLNCQMSYYREAKHADFFRHWIEWGKQNQYRRWVVPSSGVWLNSIPDSMRQIEAIRAPGKHGKKGAGVLLYSYSGTNAGPDGKEQQSEEFFAALAQPSSYAGRPPFEKPVEFPELPWKVKPKTGVVKGFVLTADALNPVDGAKVTLAGKIRRTVRTDGTGFYAFIDVPPGDYQVRVEARGYAKAAARSVIKLGEAQTTTVMLGAAATPSRTSLDIHQEKAGTPVRVADAEVVVGTDTAINTLVVSDGGEQPHRVRVHLLNPPLLPLQPGDRVALTGAVCFVEGEALIEADAVRLVDMRPVGKRVDGTGEAPASLVHAGELAPENMCATVRLQGRVNRALADRVVLITPGVLTEVMLTGRKLPGVETAPSAIPPPTEGSRVEVDGFVVPFTSSDGVRGLRLFPLSAEAVRVVPLTVADRLQPLVKWSWIPLCAAIVPVWRWRKRRFA